MRKTLSDRNEVAHFWANKVQSEGKAGNMFFQDGKIYSYGHHFCIARHIPGAVVMTTRGYSSSTRQHISKVRSAARHLRTVYAYDPSESATRNRAESMGQINNVLTLNEKKSIRQTTIDKNKAHALHIATQFNDYLAALPKAERTVKPINTAKLDQFRALMIKEQKAKERAREKEIAKRAKAEIEYMADWRKDCTMYTQGMYSLPVALRLNGDSIETSKGARIPVSDAIRLWPIILRVKSGNKDYQPGMAIGHYRLTQIKTSGDLVVGCHDIAFAEIEAMSKLLGL